jgi:hypothetical protein
VERDPYGLRAFFPCPQPLYDDHDSTSLVPVPDFSVYAEQARELAEITTRIKALVKIIRLRGVYDGSVSELSRLQDAKDGELVPARDTVQLMSMGKTLADAVWFWPIEVAAAVLQQLYVARDQIKASIYEIAGVADILRGVSDPRETLGAQQIKTQFGGQRIEEKQRSVQRFARDMLRLKAEMFAEHATPDLIQRITGIPLPQPQPQFPMMGLPPELMA